MSQYFESCLTSSCPLKALNHVGKFGVALPTDGLRTRSPCPPPARKRSRLPRCAPQASAAYWSIRRRQHVPFQPDPGAPATMTGRGLHHTEDGSYVDPWEWKATSSASGWMDDAHFGPPPEATPAQTGGPPREDRSRSRAGKLRRQLLGRQSVRRGRQPFFHSWRLPFRWSIRRGLRADGSALLTRSRSRCNSRNSAMRLEVVSVMAASRWSRLLN